MQPRQELLQAHEVTEGPDLAAVGMSGELQPDAERRRIEQGRRLMRQQHQLACRIAPSSARRAPLRRQAAVSRAAAIVDAGQIEARVVFADRDALVAEHANAERGSSSTMRRRPNNTRGCRSRRKRRGAPAAFASGATARAARSTLPSTRSPVMATMSGASALVRSTMSSTTSRPMVGPTCRSVIWTMVSRGARAAGAPAAREPCGPPQVPKPIAPRAAQSGYDGRNGRRCNARNERSAFRVNARFAVIRRTIATNSRPTSVTSTAVNNRNITPSQTNADQIGDLSSDGVARPRAIIAAAGMPTAARRRTSRSPYSMARAIAGRARAGATGNNELPRTTERNGNEHRNRVMVEMRF